MVGAIVHLDSQIIATTSVAGGKLKGLFPNATLSSQFYGLVTWYINITIIIMGIIHRPVFH
jgi:hypothetical protein